MTHPSGYAPLLNALIASTRELRFAQMSVPNLRERELIGERIEANRELIEAALEREDGEAA